MRSIALPTTLPRRPRGRPTAAATELRDNDLLRVAAELFGRDGYAAMSIGELARLTGISKTTIYARHGDKTGLFRAICSFACRMPSGIFRTIDPAGREPRLVLEDYAAAARRSMLSRDALDFLRLAIFEAPRFPDVAAAVLAESRHVYAPLTTYLADLASAGRIGGDPAILADQFIQIVCGGFHALLVRPGEGVMTQEWTCAAVQLFCAGTGL